MVTRWLMSVGRGGVPGFEWMAWVEGASRQVYGVWRVVCGVWCMVCGVWCVVYGVWCIRNSNCMNEFILVT